jgi:hypothetical protein
VARPPRCSSSTGFLPKQGKQAWTRLPGLGIDGNHSCGGVWRRPSGSPSLFGGRSRAGSGRDVTERAPWDRSPRPERTGEVSATTCAATSSPVAAFGSSIVRTILPTCASSSVRAVIGETVQAGATASRARAGSGERPRSRGRRGRPRAPPAASAPDAGRADPYEPPVTSTRAFSRPVRIDRNEPPNSGKRALESRPSEAGIAISLVVRGSRMGAGSRERVTTSRRLGSVADG